MSEPKKEVRTIPIKVIDLIDLYLSCKEMGGKADDMAEYFLDLFPEDMTDNDFSDYWSEYKIMMEEQRADLEKQAIRLKMALFEEGKWGQGNR